MSIDNFNTKITFLFHKKASKTDDRAPFNTDWIATIAITVTYFYEKLKKQIIYYIVRKNTYTKW